MRPIADAVKVRALARTDLFQAMAEKDLQELAGLARVLRVRSGREVFRKGSKPTELFAVVDGSVRVVTSSLEARDLILRTIGAGEVFGEIAIFDRRVRTATVQAAEDSTLLVFDSRDLRAFVERRPGVAIKLLEVFARRLRDTTRQLENNVFLTVEARLAQTLVGLAEEVRSREGSRWITPRVPQTQLAAIVGTVRERINKQLKKWEREELIRVTDGRVELLDIEALRVAPAAEAD